MYEKLHNDHLFIYKNALPTAQSVCFADQIGMSKGNTRTLFSTVNVLRLLDALPSHSCFTIQCNIFSYLFNAKINNIYQKLISDVNTVHCSLRFLLKFLIVFKNLNHFPVNLSHA